MTRQVPTALLVWVCLFIAAPVWGEGDHLLSEMTDRFNALTNYTTLLDSEGEGGRNKIIYTYKKPGFIRMDFIQPHKGAMLIYSPIKNKVTLRPLSTWFFKFTLDPGNRLITDSKGHMVFGKNPCLANCSMQRLKKNSIFLGEMLTMCLATVSTHKAPLNSGT
jgi:hypothetical protein